MHVKESFSTAIERQVWEAVAISVENRKGKTLMNSKAEYNRCYLPRITTKDSNTILKEKQDDDDNSILLKEALLVF